MTRILHTEIKSGERLVATDITDLTFFPKGAILTFSSTAWSATSAKFKTIWKVCNKTNHDADPNNVPDLTDRFLRGGSSSDFTIGGGADSRSVTLQTANLPSHNHGATGLSLGGLSTSGLSIATSGGHGHSGSGSTNTGSGGHTHTVSGATSNTSKTLTGYIAGAYGWPYSSGIPGTSGICSITNENSNRGGDGGDSDNARIYIDATHSHNISGSTPDNGGTHSHDVNVTIPESGSHSHTISGSITGGSISGSTANAGSGTAFSVATLPSYYTVIYIIKVA
ncbi:MAG: hypothetical protein LBL50_00155 [Candidatus Margulisbacteria bacterium]|jgi:hypothetical protein|nr:hypothetical protein [Candidatus Margulisiibacteriota bacterium]